MKAMRIRHHQLIHLLGENAEAKLERLVADGWLKPTEKTSKVGNIRFRLAPPNPFKAPPRWAEHLWHLYEHPPPF
jgi:hypothetical protein